MGEDNFKKIKIGNKTYWQVACKACRQGSSFWIYADGKGTWYGKCVACEYITTITIKEVTKPPQGRS